MIPRRTAWLVGFAVAWCAAARASTPQGAQQTELEFFESKVRPLLAAQCFECHSSGAAKVKGGLKLDSRAALAAGGASGAVVVAGDPEASALVEAVRYSGAVQMPPKAKLDAASIRVLEEWVERGAYFPESADELASADAAAPRPAPWSFAPLGEPEPPAVRDAAWCRNALDRFVLAALEARGLEPAPEADRRTLLRRLSFDLIGLPPSSEELASFERDTRPDAWERQIERLLASPHFGERWGRMWLDLARYADSNGLDENLAMSNAWRYRDWVVRALNADLPYDQFLTLQLAGDLLPEPEDEAQWRDQLTATGFLVLGPKMLAEQDKEKLVHDVVDEQMDVAFRTFQGLTLGCARCHDHKFDPLTQRDYFALAGIFQSTATLGDLGFVSRWSERELAHTREVEARRAQLAARDAAKAELERIRRVADESVTRGWSASLAAHLLAGQAALKRVTVVEAEDAARGNLLADRETYGAPDVVVARTSQAGMQFAEFEVTLARAGRVALEVRMAAEESRPMRLVLNGATAAEGVLEGTTGSWKPEGQRWFRVATLELHAGLNLVRLERDGAVPHLDTLVFAPLADGREDIAWTDDGDPWTSEVTVDSVRGFACALASAARRSDGVLALWARCAELPEASFVERAAAVFGELRAQRGAGALEWNAHVARLLDGLPPLSLRELAGRYQVLVASADQALLERRRANAEAAKLDDAALEALRLFVHGPASPFRLGVGDFERSYAAEHRALVSAARAELQRCEAELRPEFERALAVRDAERVVDAQLQRRGNHVDKVGEPIPRGALELFSEMLSPPAIAEHESGRLQLARWMLAPENPLTARVAVNRLWQGHFGRGLVASSSNFGNRGDPPTHPELLDWLARELRSSGWSMKALHRLICQSATYRMASDAAPRILEADPENLWLSRHGRRRIEAEVLRDTLLALSNQLDRTLGGTLLATENGGYVTNDQSNDAARYDAPRRSLYLPIIRNAMLDLFSTFDYPDASMTVEQRPQTTSASQALYLMNSPLVVQASRVTVDPLMAIADERERLDALYHHVVRRAPTDDQRSRALRFVSGAPRFAQPPLGADVGRSDEPAEASNAARERWRALAQVLLISNDVLYVD